MEHKMYMYMYMYKICPSIPGDTAPESEIAAVFMHEILVTPIHHKHFYMYKKYMSYFTFHLANMVVVRNPDCEVHWGQRIV